MNVNEFPFIRWKASFKIVFNTLKIHVSVVEGNLCKRAAPVQVSYNLILSHNNDFFYLIVSTFYPLHLFFVAEMGFQKFLY